MGSLGADPKDQLPFKKHAKAAESLLKKDRDPIFRPT
jgi:hypothetical protein